MNEQEWFTCNDPAIMIDWARSGKDTGEQVIARHRMTDRKLRLFGCAAVKDLVTHEYSKEALKIAEQFADGNVTESMRKRACQIMHGIEERSPFDAVAHWVVAGGNLSNVLYSPNWQAIPFSANIFREVIGNPWRHRCLCDNGNFVNGCPMATRIRTPLVLNLAQDAYNTMHPDCFQVLADALIDAGCENQSVLQHLRGIHRAIHVKGCWALDLILEKS